MMFTNLVLSIGTCLYFFSAVIADCNIDPILLEHPLILTTNGTEVLYPPHGSKTLPIKAGHKVDFVCPGGDVNLEGQTTGSAIAIATCISDTKFTINGKEYSWREVTCPEPAVATARWTGKHCLGGEEAEVGFDLGADRFVRVIDICNDRDYQITIFTKYEITASIKAPASTTPLPSFQENPGFYNLGNTQVRMLYTRDTQRKTINGLLGLSDIDIKYIKDDDVHYLVPGHLAAVTDFLYPAQINATFQYINSAPQWQTFNGYNWEKTEIDTRDYASKHNVNLQIYTGIYGVTTIPHSINRYDKALYLYKSGYQLGIPVPAIFWKVVYEPITQRGVVLVGINNPYETNVTHHVYCEDVSSKLNWLSWDRTSIQKGYSYACDFEAFRSAVNYAPKLTVTGLLV